MFYSGFNDIGYFLVEPLPQIHYKNFLETNFTSDDFCRPENFILLALKIVFNSGVEKEIDAPFVIIYTWSSIFFFCLSKF